MDSTKVRQFRAEQSQEKVEIARKLYEKGDYRNALIQAYLSIFYSVRILLLEENKDSDDFDKIITLADKYYQPSGWISFDVASLMKEGHNIKHNAEKSDGVDVKESDALRFVESAEKLYQEIVLTRSQSR